MRVRRFSLNYIERIYHFWKPRRSQSKYDRDWLACVLRTLDCAMCMVCWKCDTILKWKTTNWQQPNQSTNERPTNSSSNVFANTFTHSYSDTCERKNIENIFQNRNTHTRSLRQWQQSLMCFVCVNFIKILLHLDWIKFAHWQTGNETHLGVGVQ